MIQWSTPWTPRISKFLNAAKTVVQLATKRGNATEELSFVWFHQEISSIARVKCFHRWLWRNYEGSRITKQPTTCTWTNSIIIIIVIIIIIIILIIIISVLHARRPPTLQTCSFYYYKIGHQEAPVLAKRTVKQTIKTNKKKPKKIITIYWQTQQNIPREQPNPPLILTNKELTHTAMLVKIIINSK